MGYKLWTTTNHEAMRVGYSGTQLGYSTRASTRTARQSIRLSMTLVTVACVVAIQPQAAAVGEQIRLFARINGTRRLKQSQVFFLTITTASNSSF